MSLLKNSLTAFFIILSGWSFDVLGQSALKTADLTCEYIKNPLGVDIIAPRFSWIITGNGRNQSQSAYEILVSDHQGQINQLRGNVWETGKVLSTESIHIKYEGTALKSFTRYYWRVRVYSQDGIASAWSEPQWFETAALSGSDWKGQWISDGSKQFVSDQEFYEVDRSPLMRKSFSILKKPVSARLYVAGLGYYEAYLNGKKVGDHVLDPGWTAYDKEVLYAVYDITQQINKGMNTTGVMLGNGWYNPLPLRFWGSINLRNGLTTGRPCLTAMIHLNYADGSKVVIGTDDTWQTAPGPVLKNSVYLGEVYDARLEKAGWSMYNSAKEGWQSAKLAKGPAGRLRSQMQPPIRVTAVIEPVSVSEVKPGVFVFDMGQNFAGVARIHVKGPSGTKVTLRYGEDKYPDGNVNFMTSVTGQIKHGNGGPGAPTVAYQEDSYTLKGGDKESWSPRFTFHGFRYIEVSGWPGKPTIKDIQGLRMNADLKKAGEFNSSNAMFNQLHKTVQWTFLSNVFSLQSDCPAREKFGYGGDLFCTTEAFMYNYNMANFYGKVVRDFTNDQRPLGGITETMPFVGIADSGLGDGSGPLGFQVGFPYLIKKIHDFYGDKRIIEENYEALRRHVAFLRSKAKDHLLDREDLGDHESLDAKSIPFTPSVFYYIHVRLMADFAAILGRSDDVTTYTNLAELIKKAVVKKFDGGQGQFETGTQTAQIFALWSQIADGEREKEALEKLHQAFEKKNWHLSTGIFGTKMMFDVLRKADKNEAAYRVANQRDFPGWGFMLKNGATTLWETWAPSDNVFSKNHPMFGSVDEWFYRSLLGINAAEPGFKRIIIKPQPAGDLTSAKGSLYSVYGVIGSAWETDGKSFKLDVSIPVNTSAEIWLTSKYGSIITEGGQPIAEKKEITPLRLEHNYLVFKVGSGKYSFLAKSSNSQ